MNAAPKSPCAKSPLRDRNLLLRARGAEGLTQKQWRVVRALAESHSQPLQPRQIGGSCLISSPSLASLLARMKA